MSGDVTVLIYTFPPVGQENGAFSRIVASIQQTWKMLGKLPTVIVSSHRFKVLDDFERQEQVDVQIEPSLVPGSIKTMSMDCIQRLYLRFSTKYVLIIQEDGFPVRDNLDDFIGNVDFWGAPIISDGWRRKLAYTLGVGSFNGGFSLRSRRLCEYAARMWWCFFRYVFSEDSKLLGEDLYYTTWLRLLPLTWLRFHFPSEQAAFRFSIDRLGGKVSPPPDVKPFGVHGRDSGYNLPTEVGA